MRTRQGVVHGFDDHVLAETLSQRHFNQEIVAAKATMPVNGQDARIRILVSGGNILCYGTAKVGDLGAEGARTSLSIHYEQEEDFLAEKAP